MPNYLCKHCNSINQVAPDASHFTCKKCGKKQETPSYLESVENKTLDDVVLSETPVDDKEKPFIAKQFDDPEKPEPAPEAEAVTVVDEITRKKSIYYKAISKMGGDDIALYREAIELLKQIGDWKNARELITECEQTIERLSKEQRLAAAEEKKRKKHFKLAVKIAVPLLSVLAIFAVVFVLKIYPDMRYHKAEALAESGDAVGAYELFSELNDYSDSRERAQTLYDNYKTEKFKNALVGETVYLGTYEQDGDTQNGKEDIEWVVLDKAGDKLLLTSCYGLDYQKYSQEKVDTTWETSSMRQWLNSTFLEEAFSEEEAAHIITTDLPTDRNPDYETAYGNATQDKVFLLSITQVKQYFPTEKERLAAPTELAVEQGVYNSKKTYSGIHTCCWLLRTPGSDNKEVAYVYYDGTIRYTGASVNTRGATFRPAMWVQP